MKWWIWVFELIFNRSGFDFYFYFIFISVYSKDVFSCNVAKDTCILPVLIKWMASLPTSIVTTVQDGRSEIGSIHTIKGIAVYSVSELPSLFTENQL